MLTGRYCDLFTIIITDQPEVESLLDDRNIVDLWVYRSKDNTEQKW